MQNVQPARIPFKYTYLKRNIASSADEAYILKKQSVWSEKSLFNKP